MSFVTQKDYDELSKQGVDFKSFQPIFLKELKIILLELWSEEYHKDLEDLENKSLEDFNKIINYPSYGGYAILEDTFTNVDNTKMNIMSNTSKSLFGYFYGIHFH
tara:strand:+ start:1925 stop:2239 length:315 start_codon:yes stop_codon:yes gene_type:complete